jgi:Ca-activated chloride channel family protein
MNSTASSFGPIAATTAAPIQLAMQRLWLTGQILPAGARLVVQHEFRSGEERPLEVIYSFMLPRDAALRSFRITGEGFDVHSELKETAQAVKAYERGIADGSLAALARPYADGVVNLTIGNIRPKEKVTVHLELLAGVELRDDGLRFRFPFTLAPAYHPRMRTAVVDGEGEMELPASEFGDVILPRFREDASSLHEVGFELMLPAQVPIARIGSPSHSIDVRQTKVTLAPERDLPNRDLVLDVEFQSAQTHILAGPAADGKPSFAIVIPSTAFGEPSRTGRRVAILLDRSGSMGGAPIEQARKAIEACLAALTEQDYFGLFAFNNHVAAMSPHLMPATRQHRDAARDFLQKMDPGGGTALAAGVSEAAKAIAGEGDILILTDGQVSGTEEILAQARATGIRLFCLGIGSASQDRFLSLLARETGGNSRFVTPRERVDLPAVDLFASMGRPVACGLKAEAAQPEPPRCVFAGTPVLLFGEGDRVDLTWDGGRLRFDVPAGDPSTGEIVRLLRGSRLITDWESRYPKEEALGIIDRRKQSRVAARLTELSQTYRLTSREMSLVAVVKRSGDRPGELPDTRVVPVGMPQDTAFGAYFTTFAPACASAVLPPPPPSARAPRAKMRFGLFSLDAPAEASLDFSFLQDREVSVDGLVSLAAQLEPDGGMPGKTMEFRTARSIALLFAFAAAGHTPSSGAFRAHVQRLVDFLKSLNLSASEAEAVRSALSGTVPAAPWDGIALDPRATRAQVAAALRIK